MNQIKIVDYEKYNKLSSEISQKHQADIAKKRKQFGEMKEYTTCFVCKEKLSDQDVEHEFEKFDYRKYESFKRRYEGWCGYFMCERCNSNTKLDRPDPYTNFILGKIGFIECVFATMQNEDQQKWFDSFVMKGEKG